MAINLNSISTVTFNMHGFNQGFAYIKDICDNQTHDIIFIQEHWLQPSTLHKIININNKYVGFGKSAMQSELECSFLKGRPYGGTAILVNKKFEHLNIESFIFDRVVAIVLGDFLFINVYLPNNNGSIVHMDTLSEILANVCNIIDSVGAKYIVFGGDLNTDINRTSVHSDIILNFMEDYELMCCKKQLFGSCDVQPVDTYVSETLNCSSCIDFLCVSNTLSDNVSIYKVLDVYSNHSDHLPVSIVLCLPVNSLLHSLMNEELGQNQNIGSKYKGTKPKVSRLRWDKGNIPLYQELTCCHLYPIYTELSHIESNAMLMCNSDSTFIDDVYARVVSTLHSCAEQAIPTLSSTTFKHWWSSELNEFKTKSLTSHNIWVQAGRPHAGEIYCKKRDDKLRYKLAIRTAKREAESVISDELHENLSKKNSVNFWKTWKSKIVHKTKESVSVAGFDTDDKTTSAFAKYFSGATSPNTSEYNNAKREEFFDKFLSYRRNKYKNEINAELVAAAVFKMQEGKAAGYDNIFIEHISNCHVIIYALLAKLFNLMLTKGKVPSLFGIGIIIPIPKENTQKKVHPVENFRGITLSPIVSKVFEHCLMSLMSTYLTTSDNQFGFKSNTGCTHAVYAVRKVTEYFVCNDSTVNVCFLDISKGFDKVNNYELMLKLMQRRTPSYFIDILIGWFSVSQCLVRWNEALSGMYKLEAGVRQGGILSPVLFAVYVDNMLCKLKTMGCTCRGLQVGAFMYADDLVLISASVYEMQKMLNMCKAELKLIDLNLNVKKSKAIRIGKRFRNKTVSLSLDGQEIKWSNEARYLGVMIVSACRFKCNFDVAKAKFYRSANSILAKLGAKQNVTVTLYLIATIALPSLTYCMEALNLNKSELHTLNHPWLRSLHKIFKTFDPDVITFCCSVLNYKEIPALHSERVASFRSNLSKSSSGVVKVL